MAPYPHLMPTCTNCGAEREAEELCRHEREGMVLVHCPECNAVLGYYRDRSLRRA